MNAPDHTTAQPLPTGALNDSSFLQQLDPRLTRPFLVGFSDSISLVFLVGAAVMAIAFVLLLFLKEVPLRTQSGVDARAAEDRHPPRSAG